MNKTLKKAVSIGVILILMLTLVFTTAASALTNYLDGTYPVSVQSDGSDISAAAVTVIGGRVSFVDITMNGSGYAYCLDPVTGVKINALQGVGNSVFRINFAGESFAFVAASQALQELRHNVTLDLSTLPFLEEESQSQVPEDDKEQKSELEEKLAEADALIDKIGVVSISSRDAIEAARAAVNTFSEEEQRGLKNLFVLDAAEKTLAEIEKKIADADALIEKIGDDIDLGSQKDIEAARAAVDALSEDEKNELKNLTKLRSAEDIFKVLKEAAEKEASEDARKKEILSYIAAGAVIVIMIALIIFINVRKAKKQQ